MIEEQIKEFINKNLIFTNNGYPYRDDDSFLDNGIIDSIGIMQLVMFVEEQYKCRVYDAEITPTNFDSVICLAEFIRTKTRSVI